VARQAHAVNFFSSHNTGHTGGNTKLLPQATKSKAKREEKEEEENDCLVHAKCLKTSSFLYSLRVLTPTVTYP
jgi:Flp pilus assembly CpaF family ATPase